MSPIKFSTRKVRKALLQLNTSKSSGPDGIPAIVLKSFALEITPVLNKLFQLSNNFGVFPSSWKLAYAFLSLQKGYKSDPSNYRPTAITSLISKTIITKQSPAFLETNKLLSDHQYEFETSLFCSCLVLCSRILRWQLSDLSWYAHYLGARPSTLIYKQIPDPSFSGVLLSYLGWCS